jgi:hypothetical protein
MSSSSDFSAAALSIGLGGTGPESDEERRKRLLQQAQSRLLPNSGSTGGFSNGYSAALSPAGQSLNL